MGLRPHALWLAALAALAGCARSHGLEARGDAGGPRDGMPPRAIDDGSVRDGGHDATPDVVDAAGALDAAATDAGDGAAEAGTPSNAFLVYSTRDVETGVTTAHVMRGDDFSVRRLDPAGPAERPTGGTPVAYAQDSSWLLVKERHEGHVTKLWLMRRCRLGHCLGRAEPHLIASYSNRVGRHGGPYLRGEFTPDGRGILLEGWAGGRYVPLTQSGPEPSIGLASTDGEVHLLGDSQAVLGYGQQDPRFLDLHPPDDAPLEAVTLAAPGPYDSTVTSISPDGRHWLTATYRARFAYALEAVRAGDLEGQALSDNPDQVHAGDGFLVARREDEVTLYAWDALDTPLPLASGIDTLVGCGNHLALLRGDGVSFADLAPRTDDALPPLLEVDDVVTAAPRFLGDCAMLRLTSGDWPPSQVLGVDPDDGRTLEVTGGADQANADASLLASGYGLHEVVRTDTIGDASPVRYAPRASLFDTRIQFIPGRRALLAAGPLRDLLEWRVFEVSFDAAGPPEVRPLTPQGVEVNQGFALSPDGRYLAYGVGYPTLPADPETLHVGVFEHDLSTGVTEQLTAPVVHRARGTRRILPIPGQPAVVLVGDYAGQDQGRTSLLVANLETEALLSQIPDETPRRTLVDSARAPFDDLYLDDQRVSSDGKTLWYRAVVDGAARYAQPLRLRASEPLREATVLRFEQPEPPYAQEGYEEPFGFVKGVGPVYTPKLPYGAHDALHYFDVRSGQEHSIAAIARRSDQGLIPEALGETTGRLALRHTRFEQDDTLLLARVGEAGPPLELETAHRIDHVQWSPDERWLTFVTQAAGAALPNRHFHDAQTGARRVLTGVSEEHDLVLFGPDGARALYVAADGTPRQLDLDALDAEPTSPGDEPSDAARSDDWRWVAWPTDEGVVVERRDPSPMRWTLETGSTHGLRLSPSGQRLLVQREEDGLWLLFRTGALEAGGEPLGESAYMQLSFGPEEKLVLGRWRSSHGLAVWSLADPGAPKHHFDDAAVRQVFWVDGSGTGP